MNDELVRLLENYRADPGIRAALLIGSDGFLVASAATDGVDTTAVAAQVADVLGVAHRLALELGQQETRYATFELTSLNVLVAPFEGALLLVLVGEPDALRLSYSLRTPV
jgi:predicted regulator of Ras-like GTPase activity (Roadblock/LC7/MglB family)